MRIIHRASMVFLLKDVYSRTPVTNAVILCNGKQNPYTRKDCGHYVFSNLSPGKYDIYINCTGYNDLNLTVDLKENQTQIMDLNLSYAPNNLNISRVTRFKITCKKDGELLKNSPVKLILLNELADIKVTEESATDSDLLKLNVNFTPELLDQNYLYEFDEIPYE